MDDDDLGRDRTRARYWRAGVFYVNPDDDAIFVEKRFGGGSTVNFGHPWAWMLVALLVLAILIPIGLSVWGITHLKGLVPSR